MIRERLAPGIPVGQLTSNAENVSNFAANRTVTLSMTDIPTWPEGTLCKLSVSA
jgi:hypothetical protein